MIVDEYLKDIICMLHEQKYPKIYLLVLLLYLLWGNSFPIFQNSILVVIW